MILTAVALTIVSVLNFLLVVAILVLLIVGVRWLIGLAGWSLPQPIWTIIGVIVCLILLIMLFNGGVPVLIGGHR